jgi:hypothetical protein
VKGGLSKHRTKSRRLKVGKKPEGKERLFWPGHQRVIAAFRAATLRH